MSLASKSPDTAFLARLVAVEQGLENLQKSGMLNNSSVTAFLGSSGSNRGLRVMNSATSDAQEVCRLGVSEAGLYGLSTLDSNGFNRAQFGDITGGGFGFELRDASNALIADSTGLAAVTKLVGSVGPLGSFAVSITTTEIDATGLVTGAFTIGRPVDLLVLTNGSWAADAGTGDFGLGHLRLRHSSSGATVADSGLQAVDYFGTQQKWSAIGATAYFPQVAAGTYEVAFRVKSDTGACTSVGFSGPAIFVLQRRLGRRGATDRRGQGEQMLAWGGAGAGL